MTKPRYTSNFIIRSESTLCQESCLFPFTATHATGEPVSTMIVIGFVGTAAGKIESGIALLSQVCL